MMKPFVSVYEPVHVTIDGVEYPLKKRNRAVLKELSRLQEKLPELIEDAEKIDLGYQQATLLVDAPQEIIDNLDSEQVRTLLRWISALLSGKDEPGGGEEKNGPRPGDEPPAA